MAPFEILLIEDDPEDRFMFESAVKASRLPITLTSAASAAKAVARLNRSGEHADAPRPRVVVMDLGLPGLSGKGLIQQIRNAYGKGDVCIIVLTGSLDEDDRIDCELLGISGYFAKPSRLEPMIELVMSLPLILDHPPGERVGPGRGN